MLMSSNPDASTRRRVKLYMLNEDRQWDDKGTGHVSATFVEGNSMALVVISETDGSHLLESKIQHDTAYQKQQETLIVWSEGDNVDLALSFQEKTGCDDIWEKICNVQGKDPSVDITQDLIDDADDADDMDMDSSSASNNQGFDFPTCDLTHLPEISEMFTQVISYPIQRERLATALERSQYLKQLLDLFHKAEDLEDIKSLHHLYEIMRSIIQFNRRSLYELIFSDEMMMDIIGMLEYNPNRRVKHREFLTKKANYKEILPINSGLKNKIHQTYRVQYIQDNCLPPPSLFDDNAGSSLNSYIYLNKIDIITKLQDDTQFMQHLFSNLINVDISIENRRDLLGLLKEFCTIVNSLQPTQKESFFTSLCQNKALKAIFYSFKIADDPLKAICVDILQIFIENQPSMVREFFIKDSLENSSGDKPDSLYVNVLIDHLINDLDSELSIGFLIMNILKVLIDPENMINSSQRNEKQEFLNFFYKNCMQHLTRPLFDLTADNQLKYDDYHTAMVMHNIVELLSFCVEFHSYHMKNHAFHNNILLRVAILFKSQHKFLVLAALRVIRKFIASKEEFNYRYIIKNNIFGDIVALLDANRHYNMLNSAILELFEFIRTENISCLITNIIENYWDILQHHNYVSTFQMIKTRYDQSLERSIKTNPPQISNNSSNSINMLSLMNAASRIRRDPRTLDEDEEQWYDQDDEEDDDILSQSSLYPSSATFIERITRGSSVKDSENVPYKLTNRFREQQIPINIKSTNLTLGSVSSTSGASTAENGCGFDGEIYKPVTNESQLVNGDSKVDESAKVSRGESDTQKISDSSVMLTGLVDYGSDDEDENEISSNSVTSPKRLKME